MNLAKISANGQVTVPVEIRRLLGLKSGDKILFFQKQDEEVIISNTSAQTIRKAQTAFSCAKSIENTGILGFYIHINSMDSKFKKNCLDEGTLNT